MGFGLRIMVIMGLEAFSVGVLVLDWEGKDGWHGFA
jgi:hypothetical protein